MKKFLLLFIPFLFSVALQGRVKDIILPEKGISKTVRFSIYASTNYSPSLYKHSKAKVLLSIWKYKKNVPELVWQTTVDAGELRNYPSSEEALFREVSLYNIRERKEMLVASYTVVYESKGSELSYNEGYVVPVGDSVKKVSIPI